MNSRNPKWERDELLLAPELYLEKGQLDKTAPEVIALSEILNQLPLHNERPNEEKFRNPAGVALKLANFRHLDPSDAAAGMSSGGKGARVVWDEFADNLAELKRINSAIKKALAEESSIPYQVEEQEEGVSEGKVLYRLHRRRERNLSKAKKKKKLVFEETGRLACEVCSFDFTAAYGEHGIGFIECHHIIPLSQPDRGTTKLKDLALVCANCHRMLHRGKPWPTVEQLKTMINSQN